MGGVYKAPEKRESLKDLFDSWKNHYEKEYNSYKNLFKGPEYEGLEKCFFPDGYLSEQEECKILFVSRESRVVNNEVAENNNKENVIDYKDFYMRNVVNDISKSGNAGGIRYPRHMSVVRDFFGGNDVSDWKKYEKKKNFEILFDCGYMNLNKHGGRKSAGEDFPKIVKADKDYIERQINIMDPKVIVLLGKGLKDLFDKLRLDKGNKKTIETFHPASSKNIEQYIEPLKDFIVDNGIIPLEIR